jgi:hypothetical protein
MQPTRLLALTAAAAGLTLAGCKIQPIDNNSAPMAWRAMPQVEAYSTSPTSGTHASLEGAEELPPEALVETTAPPEGLGPAAREVIKYLPLGYAGAASQRAPTDVASMHQEEVKVEDRWRVGFPAWERGSQSDSPYDMSAWWDPYHQNVLKGDYPIPGTQNTFVLAEATSISRYERRRVPTPSGVFPTNAGSGGFFGKEKQTLLEETLLVTLDIFQGETSFKPVDWRLFVRGAFNYNYATASERQALYADPTKGKTRSDRHAVLQQFFFETTLASIGPKYDVIQLRVGSQLFNSDFKGFMFFDEALGARLFGSFDDNRWQWNAGYFRRWDKDTNSSLNTWDSIKQDVVVANFYRQDVLQMFLPDWKSTWWSKGLTTSFSYHHLSDDDSVHYDENDFLVRPRAVGFPAPNSRGIDYWGWSNDGHVGRLNITSSMYWANGYQSFDEIAQERTNVDAFMAALELSVDLDWMRFRAHGYYQSGDDDPLDDDAEGFDAIYDVPVFAGGEFGFWNRNTVRLTGSGVGLTQRFSLNNSLRSSKDQGQQSYTNPGLILAGIGWDAQVTPHIKVITNASYLRFDHTESMELVLNQDGIGEEIGYDLSVGIIWRPWLTDNVIVKAGFAALIPGAGYKDIYDSQTPQATFAELILTW